MAIDFSAQTLQIYKVDTSSGKRELKALTDAEKAYAEQALRGGEQAAKAHGKATKASGETTKSGKRLAQQMDILTMTTGGLGTEVGKAAEISKRLADGFGVMGVAMFGAGLLLRELAPLVGGVVDGFSDLVNYGTSERWKPLEDRIGAITGLMRTAQLQTKIWQAQLALMAPGAKAGAMLLGKEGDVSRAEEAYDAAKSASATAKADLEQLTEAVSKYGEAGQRAFASQISGLEHEVKARGRAVDEARALIELRGLEVQLAEQVEFQTNSQTKATNELTKAKQAHTRALVDQNAAASELLSIIEREGLYGGRSASQILGPSDADLVRLIEQATGDMSGAGIEGLGLGKGLGPAELIDETAAAAKRLNDSRAFSMVSDNAVDMWEAIATGAMSAADATEKAFGAILLAGGKMLAGEAIKEGVLIFTDWSKAAIHAVAAAKAAAGATAMFALAGTMGAGGGAGGVGGFTSGGGGAVQQTSHTVIYVGDSYTNESNRRKQAAFNRLMKNSGQGSYAS